VEVLWIQMADCKSCGSCGKPYDNINTNIIISVDECYMIIKRALVDCMMSVRWL